MEKNASFMLELLNKQTELGLIEIAGLHGKNIKQFAYKLFHP